MSSQNSGPLSTISFADVAHQTIIFDPNEEASALILELLDTPWVQRLRHLRQTGNANLVYMFAEHSRFGHSLGVAYLANRLMKNLARYANDRVARYRNAVAAAALLHDVGHVAPGSHLGEHIWNRQSSHASGHEQVSIRVVLEDSEIRSILERYHRSLPEQVAQILREDPSLPPWTVETISGGGWNADRGNWTIVDSAMASVSYGRYNVFALLDAYRLSADDHLVIQENRLDALTHFFVARDSMYRQVYLHRVIQGIDVLAENLVKRLRDIVLEHGWTSTDQIVHGLHRISIWCDHVMAAAVLSNNYGTELSLQTVFRMTESWWTYHLEQWCVSGDQVLKDLALRQRDRRLLKTMRVMSGEEDKNIRAHAEEIARELGFDPRYYVSQILKSDRHRGKKEVLPSVILDNGELVPVETLEPLIGELTRRSETPRAWLAVPKEVKEKLGRSR